MKKKEISFATVGAFVWKYYKRRPWAVALVIVSLFVQAALELAAPLLLGLMTDAIVNTDTSDSQAFGNVAQYLVAIAGVGMAYHIINQATHSFYDWHIKCPAMRDTGIDVFKRVQRFSLDWHSNSFSGAVVTKVKRGMNSVERFADSFYGHFIRTAILMFVIMIYLFIRWPEMGGVFLGGSLLYIAFSIWLAARFVVSQARAVAKADTALGAQLADSVTGNATVKTFAKEKHEDRLFVHIAKDWMRKLFNLYVRFNLISMAQNTLMTVIKISLFFLIIWLWSQGKATAGDFVFILGIYGLLSGYLRHIGDQVREVQRAANDLEEMVEYSQTPLQVQDVAKAKKLKVSQGAISLKNITFTYPNQAQPVFKNFSLEIKPGQRVALVGHSGSGKSTFVKLLQRFYDLNEGLIEIDGQNIARVTQASLREHISLVPQDPILFHRRLIENISYAKEKTDLKGVISVAKKAHAHEFIKNLPDQYDTLVGERGIKLSGGERQRVAIARALLADTPILVLDEATSALDSQSESYIQEALKVLMQNKTSLVIAHRLSTIKHADRILVFEKGTIIEDGTHNQLIKNKTGLYKTLFEMQAGGFIGD